MTTTTLAPIPDALLTEAFAALTPTLLATPHEALALSDLRTVLATSVWHRDSVTLSHLEITHLDHALATYATGHGWTYVPFLQNPRSSTHSAAYLRPLLPDLSRLEARLASYFTSNQRVPYAYEVLHAGLTVAFPAGVREDPDGRGCDRRRKYGRNFRRDARFVVACEGRDLSTCRGCRRRGRFERGL